MAHMGPYCSACSLQSHSPLPRSVRSVSSPSSSGRKTARASMSAARSPEAATPHKTSLSEIEVPLPDSSTPSGPRRSPRRGALCFPAATALPLTPPVLPQLARPAKTLPLGDGCVYEPKWDGFRTLAFVDGGDVYLQSRNGKPMRRYFPELTFPHGRYVLDGEIVLFDDQGRQDFDALGQRIHPAESRIRMLAEQTPT